MVQKTGHIEGSYTLPAMQRIGYINIPLIPKYMAQLLRDRNILHS